MSKLIFIFFSTLSNVHGNLMMFLHVSSYTKDGIHILCPIQIL
jgi:hypothetical protein